MIIAIHKIHRVMLRISLALLSVTFFLGAASIANAQIPDTQTSAAINSQADNKSSNSVTRDLRVQEILNNTINLLGGGTSSVRDTHGFMWFSGENGLARYDGYTVKLYKNDKDIASSLSSNFIYTLFVDQHEQLWVGTRNGLNRYNPLLDNFTHFHPPSSQQTDNSVMVVAGIAQGVDNSLWLSTFDGLYQFSISTGNFAAYKPPSEIHLPISTTPNRSWARLAHRDSRGLIWFTNQHAGIFSFNPVNQIFKYYPLTAGMNTPLEKAGTVSVTGVDSDSQDTIWLITQNGRIFRKTTSMDGFTLYEKITQQRQIATSKSGSFSINNLIVDNNDNLWYAADGDGGGVAVVDPKRHQFKLFRHDPDDNRSIPSNRTRYVHQDTQGNMWFGFFPSGVAMQNNYAYAFNNYRHLQTDDNSLTSNLILSVVEGQDESLWVGTEYGLNHIDRKSGEVKHYLQSLGEPKKLQSNSILSLLIDSENVLWVGTWRGGLSVLNPGSEDFEHLPKMHRKHPLVDAQIWGILEDSLRNVWLATNLGLYRYRRINQQFEPIAFDTNSKNHDQTQIALFEDRRHRIWVGGVQSLQVLDIHSGERLTTSQHENIQLLSGERINLITQSQDGYIWVGTNQGLYAFNGNMQQEHFYQKSHGLPDDTIVGIIEDPTTNTLWLSTGNGLARLNRDDDTFTIYDQRHGLPGNQFNRPAFTKTKRGEFVFGSTKGLTLFKPQNIYTNTALPSVFITDFQIFNKSVQPDTITGPLHQVVGLSEDITLSYDLSVFSFEFSALNYHISELNSYAYRLDGFDKEWNYIDKRHNVTYTNLDPGKYRFRVKAANSDGFWSKQDTQLNVIILPPWWQTWWAYTLYTSIVLILLAWFIYTLKQRLAYSRALLQQERVVVKKLQQVDKLKDEFLTNTSHELRTPLHGIIGLSESLIEGAGGALSETAKKNLTMIVNSGRRLSHLVDDILDFSKMRNQVLKLNRQAIDLHAVADIVLKLSEPLIGNKKLVLENTLAENLPYAFADENRLQQVLHNLIGNAIKFTDQGSVTLKAEVKGEHLHVSVQDTGIGIAEDKTSRVFELFEQVEGSTERLYSGTGLGLAVSRQLVQLHGGDITVSSKLGVGSTFTFTLPLAGASQEGEIPTLNGGDYNHHLKPSTAMLEALTSTTEVVSGEVRQRSSARMHILVVDDDPVNRQVLINHLSLHDYLVTQVASGIEAVDLIESDQVFDLVLLDIMMPRMSGFKVCEHIRQIYAPQELPVIFLTANKLESDLTLGFQVGGNDFIHKPVSKTELLSRVQLHSELLEVNRNLESAVRQRTHSLETEHKRLKQTQSQLVESEKMAGLAHLVAGLAHEFNNPLNYTNLGNFNLERDVREFQEFVTGLLEDTPEEDIVEAFEQRFKNLQDSVNIMAEGTTRIERIVGDLQAFADAKSEEFSNITVEECIRPCINLTKANYGTYVDVSFELEPGIALNCHYAQMTQAFMNIMINACQAIILNQESKQLTGKGLIEIVAKRQADQVLIEFCDNGVGMTEDTRRRMFDPFFTTRPIGEGTGLGLSIVYGLLQQNGGHIEAESTEGEGTCIHITLPLKEYDNDAVPVLSRKQ